MYATGRPLIGGSKKARRILIHRCSSPHHSTAAVVWQTFDDIHRSQQKTRRLIGLAAHTTAQADLMKTENRRHRTNYPLPEPGSAWHPYISCLLIDSNGCLRGIRHGCSPCPSTRHASTSFHVQAKAPRI